MKNSEFIAVPMRRLKLLKLGKIRCSFTFLALLLSLVLIALLSTISITDAEAVYVRNGDFKIGMAISDYSMYQGDDFNVTIFLTNTSKTIQSLSFDGSCQATFKILDANNQNVVFPRTPEETLCNNRGFEQFLMTSGQVKRYFFSYIHPEKGQDLLLPGKYTVIGVVDGFGETSTTIEVLTKPNGASQENELCEGLTGKKCGAGLECKYRGGFPDGAGLCQASSSTFEPKNTCVSGFNKCFSDLTETENQPVIEKFLLLNRISGFEDGTFRPEAEISRNEFTELVEASSGIRLKLQGDEGVRRADALTLLYKIYVNEIEPETLEDAPYVDISNSEFKNYIIRSYQLGVINIENPDRKFNPDQAISREEAIVLIDKFERLK